MRSLVKTITISALFSRNAFELKVYNHRNIPPPAAHWGSIDSHLGWFARALQPSGPGIRRSTATVASIWSVRQPARRRSIRSNTSGDIPSSMNYPISVRRILPDSAERPSRRWAGCVAARPWWNPSGNGQNCSNLIVTKLCDC